jgi:hypothetical protein
LGLNTRTQLFTLDDKIEVNEVGTHLDNFMKSGDDLNEVGVLPDFVPVRGEDKKPEV